MALINKIRERSGIAVGVLAVALLLFIVGSDIFSSGSRGGSLFGGNDNKVGVINGANVDFQEFTKLVEAQRQQFELSAGRAASEEEQQSLRDQVWEQLIQEQAFQPEYDKLGIDVTTDEMHEMIQGAKNLHPYIRQQFTDRSTGLFNSAQHREFINMAANKSLPAEQQLIWNNFKANLIKIRKSEKYQKIVSAADYITKAEAKKEYAAQNDIASAEYVFVPFYSVNDTLVKIEDSELKSYFGEHKDEFEGFDSRSFDYAIIEVLPSKEDSAALKDELTSQAKALASATNTEAYAMTHSDVRHPYLWSSGEIPAEVKEMLATTILGATFGPVKMGQNYTIYKYEGTSNTDTLFTVRASHILIRAELPGDAGKLIAKERAQGIMNELRGGGNFEALARINGSDGTAQLGGDLGYFSNNGKMVPAFEKAIFAFGGTGLLPELVETDFGYHIVKVTEAKTNLKYKLAAITKILEPSEATLSEGYQKAEDSRVGAKTADELKKKITESGNLVMLSAKNILPGAKNFNTVQNAQEVVNWAFSKEAKTGEVADRVFVVDNSYIIAALTAATEKDDPKAVDFKDQIEHKIRNNKKSELIMKKLANASGDFSTIAAKYGAGALVERADSINFQTGMLNSAGIDGIAVGRLFGMKVNTITKPFVGQNGVFIVKKTFGLSLPEIADYSQYKEGIKLRKGQYASAGLADQAVRNAAKIVDRRARMF